MLAVVMAIELFRYYLNGRHFTVVTDHASLTWLHNFREPEGMVTWWIACVQPFDFATAHRPGKHHSHADGLSQRTSRPCQREMCPECKPLRMTIVPKTEMAQCYTPMFPYQRHFDGYVEMSEEDAALFWEVDPDPASIPQGGNLVLVPSSETAPADEDISHEEVTSIGPLPNSEPDDSRCADASATFVDGSQNTKPVEPVCTVRGLNQAGAPADNTSTPGPLCPQATVGTQTNEMNQPRAETSWKDETPTTPTETIIPRPTPPKSIRTRCKGWRNADLETPYGPAPEFEGARSGSPDRSTTLTPDGSTGPRSQSKAASCPTSSRSASRCQRILPPTITEARGWDL